MDSRDRTIIARKVACMMIRAEYARIRSGESFLDKHGVVPVALDVQVDDFQTWYQLSLSNQYRQSFTEAMDAFMGPPRCPQSWKGFWL